MYIFIEVYESDKLKFESETLANYAPPNNSSPSTFIYLYISIYMNFDVSSMKCKF